MFGVPVTERFVALQARVTERSCNDTACQDHAVLLLDVNLSPTCSL